MGGDHENETRPGSRRSSASREKPPASIGGFELRDELGRGGMGVVYRAWQPALSRFVALKLMREGALATRESRELFRVEAELAAALQHPSIVTIHGAGEESGVSWCAMQLVEGERLDLIVARDGPFEPSRAARLVARIARAVQHAHDRGIVHRDIKPSNILLATDDEPRILDFGIAARVHDQSTGELIEGTPAFMAPEQAAGSALGASPSVDVHALGAVLFFLLTGRAPYDGGSSNEAMLRAIEGERPPLRSVRRDVPRELDAACSKALERLPSRRYATPQELGDDLERFLVGEPVAAMGGGRRMELRRWSARRPLLIVTWLALGLFYANECLVWMLSPTPGHDTFHRRVTLVLAAWAVTAWWLQKRTDLAVGRERWRAAWMASDAGFVTLLAWLGDGPTSVLAFVYPVLVASTALRFRRRLVWLALSCSLAGYALLVVDAAVRRPQFMPTLAEAGVLACTLLVTAAIADEVVRRMRGLAGLQRA